MDTTDWILSHRSLVLYGDCNSTKNLFGGQMLAWMDLAAGMYAQCQMKWGQVVTRQMGDVEFKVPIPLGWVCTIYAKTHSEGKSSLVMVLWLKRFGNDS